MAMVTNSEITFLNDLKPFKTTWKIEVKVIHSWIQTPVGNGEHTLEFILEDKMGIKIHCTCKSLFSARVTNLRVGQWRFVQNFYVIPTYIGIFRRTSHRYKMEIRDSTIVTEPQLHTCEMIEHNKDYCYGGVSSCSSSKRKEGEADLNDMNSPAKKLCAKNYSLPNTKED